MPCFPQRWRCRDRDLRLGDGPARVMGILNCTPDSFSDGGRFRATGDAVAEGLRMAEAGAAFLDIGGESTRPGASAVNAEEERRRVVPVIEELHRLVPDIPLSIDTTKACVAEAALHAGADIINDVSGLTLDPDMPAVAARTGAGVVVMHMQGTPRTMQDAPHYDHVVEDVLAYLRDRREALGAAGIDTQRVAWDYGIGFGKTLDHNLALLKATATFAVEAPLVVGLSRKRWIGELTGRPVEQRLGGSLGGASAVAFLGAHILRMHDVLESCDAAAIVHRLLDRHHA